MFFPSDRNVRAAERLHLWAIIRNSVLLATLAILATLHGLRLSGPLVTWKKVDFMEIYVVICGGILWGYLGDKTRYSQEF